MFVWSSRSISSDLIEIGLFRAASIQWYRDKETLPLLTCSLLSGYFTSHVKFQHIKVGHHPHPAKNPLVKMLH